MNDDKTVSAIVPVFNEGKTVGHVVKTLIGSESLSEIICINDGSTDDSLEILRRFGRQVRIINFKKNHGKGRAVAEGIRKAHGRFLFLCDADLLHFRPSHVKAILSPVLSGHSKAAFGIPTLDNHGQAIHYLKNQVYLAGERVYPREVLLPHLDSLGRTRGAGGSEVVLNTIFKTRDICVVKLKGLAKPSKEQKWGSLTALKQYLFSLAGVLQEIGRIEINSPRDFKKLENLVQADSFDGLVNRLAKIRDKRIKAAFQKYFLRYSRYFEKVRL